MHVRGTKFAWRRFSHNTHRKRAFLQGLSLPKREDCVLSSCDKPLCNKTHTDVFVEKAKTQNNKKKPLSSIDKLNINDLMRKDVPSYMFSTKLMLGPKNTFQTGIAFLQRRQSFTSFSKGKGSTDVRNRGGFRESYRIGTLELD